MPIESVDKSRPFFAAEASAVASTSAAITILDLAINLTGAGGKAHSSLSLSGHELQYDIASIITDYASQSICRNYGTGD